MATNVLIVDDTVVYRKILTGIVTPLADGGLVATAPSGALALKKLAQTRFDIVLLDVQMPDMDGIETLTRIRAEFPDIAVAMVSAATAKGSETAIKALNLGALDLIRKPQGQSAADSERMLRNAISSVMRVIETRRLTGSARAAVRGPAPSGTAVAAPPRPTAVPISPAPRRPYPRGSFSLLAIGSSTGGPEALSHLVPNLPGSFPLPVVIVQHMPPVFTEALARDLDRRSALAVKEVADGDAIIPGRVLIARGGCHMVVRAEADQLVARLDDGPPENSCRPAVDVLFRSLGEATRGGPVIAVVLTGMGADGMRGVQALKQSGCHCITQSAATCVVYGMPQAVDSAGLSDESVDINDIAPRIVSLAGQNRSAA